MSRVNSELPEDIAEQLQGQTIVILNVVARESGDIYSTSLSWAYAVSRKAIRFAIDAKSDVVGMIKEDPRVVLTFASGESVYAVKGAGVVKIDKTEGLTLKMALIEVSVQEVRDIMFYGGKIMTPLAFVKTYNAELVRKLDDEMKQALISLS